MLIPQVVDSFNYSSVEYQTDLSACVAFTVNSWILADIANLIRQEETSFPEWHKRNDQKVAGYLARAIYVLFAD